MGKKLILTMVFGLFWAVPIYGSDWPQWRGPGRDGIWPENGIVQKFESSRLNIRWRAKIANGYSGPTVAGGRVYITDRLTIPAQTERVHCFDAVTGEKIWSYEYECKYEKIEHRNGPRASVIIDENRAYSLGTMGHFYCFDAATGKVLWSKDLDAEYAIRMPTWGISSCPIIENNLVIAHIGGKDNASIVAFDKETGTERWRALNDPVSYSAPIVINQADKRVLVCWTAERIVGLAPETGELYWKHEFTLGRISQNIASPVFSNNFLFVSSFFDGSLLLKLNPDKPAVEELWRRKGPNERNTDSLHCCISTPIIEGDYIYGIDSYGELRCLDLRTGDRIWESLEVVPKERWANVHMIRQQDKVWMFNERGELIISKLSPRGYQEISRTKLIEPTEGQLAQRGGVCWSHPAFAYKHVFVRNDEELLCADLSAKE
jgi:outer membrane protein assembly factor BamB